MVVEILGAGFRASGGMVGDGGGGDGDGGVVSTDRSGSGWVCIARRRGRVGGI